MSKAGANISGCPTTNEDNGFIEKIRINGADVLYTSCDVTKEEDLKKLVGDAIKRFGQIDVLVSNAGRKMGSGAEKTISVEWDQNMQLNLASHWKLAQVCKPHLEKNKGVIIIMTSNHAFSSISGCFPYNVAKTALIGLVRSLAIEWAPNIGTVGIAPGLIDTPNNQKWFDSFPDEQKEKQRTTHMHPASCKKIRDC